jgi:hypothetical protein
MSGGFNSNNRLDGTGYSRDPLVHMFAAGIVPVGMDAASSWKRGLKGLRTFIRVRSLSDELYSEAGSFSRREWKLVLRDTSLSSPKRQPLGGRFMLRIIYRWFRDAKGRAAFISAFSTEYGYMYFQPQDLLVG